MSLPKRICLLVAGLCLTSQALAVTAPGTATVTAFADPSITQDQIVNFGTIPTAAATSCVMNAAGVVTAPCLGTPAAGQYTIDTLQPNSNILVTVTGGTNGNVTFVPITNSAGAAGGDVTNLLDGVQSGAITTDGATPVTPVVLTVFGTMTVGGTALVGGAVENVTFTIDVVYQ